MDNIIIDNIKSLKEKFQFKEGTKLSEAIIMAAIAINKPSRYLPVVEYRNHSFSKLWREQFSTSSDEHWTPQFRTELNQGEGRLAYRVFESPDGKGFTYRLKELNKLNINDKKTVEKLIKIVKNLKAGKDIIDSFDEEEFQSSIQLIEVDDKLQEGIIKRPKTRKVSEKEQFSRNPKMAKRAIVNANYSCEYNSNHITFIMPQTGHYFMEAHHVIPMELQGQFKVSIDVPENIASLCPNCHRQIHKAKIEIKRKMIEELLSIERIEKLKERGIDYSIESLIKHYL